MQEEFTISIYLDTRRQKSSGKFPVKLRVYDIIRKRTKLYPTKFDLTETEFKSAYLSKRPRKEFKDQRNKLLALETSAREKANEVVPFTIEGLEKRLFRRKGDGVKIAYHYKEKINDLKTNNQIGTADIYELSQKSIISFLQYKKGKTKGTAHYKQLTFHDIDARWLKAYQRFMIDYLERSTTTVSIYLRSLRSIYNSAISDGELSKQFYPFGSGKTDYTIPEPEGTKRALNQEQLSILFNADPSTMQQEKAKDYWFFSYACNGMNLKDIARLKQSDLTNDTFSFFRAKTGATTKKPKKITVYLNEYTKSIIKKYGNAISEMYVFPIIEKGITVTEEQRRIKKFTRFINQHIKKLAKDNGLPEEISCYWARHSFATRAINSGASMEFVQESLGHKNLGTTQKYFNGFEDKAKREISKSLMNFTDAS